MTTPDPLATYLYTGGLSRVCEELARVMRVCHNSIGHHLPSLDGEWKPTCGDTSVVNGEPVRCSKPPGHSPWWHQDRNYTWPLSAGRCSECGNLPQDGHSLTCSQTYHVTDPVSAHPAPASSPGEDKPDILRSLSPEEFAQVEPISEMEIRDAIDRGQRDAALIDDPNHPTYRNERDQALEELARVKAELKELDRVLHRTHDTIVEPLEQRLSASEALLVLAETQRNDAVTELERVRAENARLAEELDIERRRAAHEGDERDQMRAKCHRTQERYRAVRREVRRLNAVVRLCNLQEIARTEATREIGKKHRQALADKDAGYDQLAQINYDHAVALQKRTTEVLELRAELAKREVVVGAARKWLKSTAHATDMQVSGCVGCELSAALSALEQPQAEPGREIVVVSEWRNNGTGDHAKVEGVDDRTVHIRWLRQGERRAWPVESFLQNFTHVSDPPVSEGEG